MYKKTYVLILLLIFATAAATGCQLTERNGEIYYGTAEMEQYNISSETSGTISDIKVTEGSAIKAGDIIAQINAKESSIKAAQAETGVQSAANELNRVVEGARQEEIDAQKAVNKQLEALVNQASSGLKQAETAVKQAEINADSAEQTYRLRRNDYDNIKNLFERGSVSGQELDNAEYTMSIAKNSWDISKAAIEAAKTQLDSAKAQKEAAKQQLEAGRQKLLQMQNGAADTAIKAAELNAAQAESSYELSKLNLEKTEIKSAVDGIIDTINYGKGEFILQGSPVATVIDPSSVWVKIYVPEKVLSQIKLNQEVVLSSDFIEGKIKGRISKISSEAEYSPMNVVTKGDREKLVYEVKITLSEGFEKVKAGMLLEVRL
ncbi:MAG: transporter [Clostridia bacterium]|nr:transporter [Clostridia bacterium]